MVKTVQFCAPLHKDFWMNKMGTSHPPDTATANDGAPHCPVVVIDCDRRARLIGPIVMRSPKHSTVSSLFDSVVTLQFRLSRRL